MDHEVKRSPFITLLLQRFCINFSVIMMTITVAGMLISRFGVNNQNTDSLFSFDGNGLSYGTILQFAAFSAIVALFSVLLFDERFSSKLRFISRIFFFMLVIMITASFFVIVFNWFPLDDVFAWLSFAALTIICFAISFGLTMLKIKRERETYGKLLADFKARKKT
jgi:magnesium-transporting ATPase (P-type)